MDNNMDRTWLKEHITMSYEDLFNYVTQSNILRETLNDNKLAEVGFEIPHLVYIQKNNKSPYIKNQTMDKTIKYIKGDATEPVGEGKKYIVHICNDIGGWGRGFVLALSAKWKEPEKEYREWFRNGYYDNELDFLEKSKLGFDLGNIQVVPVEENICVINMIAQHGCYPIKDVNGNIVQPIRYVSLVECLNKVTDMALKDGASVHMPMIGSGLAGGDWAIIEGLINNTLIKNGVDTTVYVFDEN